MKLVIWDIDGTLVDSHAQIMQAMEAGTTRAGLPPLPAAQVSSIVGLSLPVAVATLLPDADPVTRAEVVEGYRSHYFAARSAAESPLFPGALDCLRQLAGRSDLLMAVATGKSRRGLDGLLAAHGLGGYFAATHCADGHPSKPAPGMILSCLSDTGARDAVMIGDTSFDMLMARNAGIAGLGVGWGHHPAAELFAAGARSVATDFPQLHALIEEWAA